MTGAALVALAWPLANGEPKPEPGVVAGWVIAGAVLLIVAVALAARRAPLWIPITAGVAGVALVAVAFVLPRVQDGDQGSEATIRIGRPRPESKVPAGKPVVVVVDVNGGEIATSETENGGHVHLYVDGELEQMPYSTEMRVTLDKGKHQITVEYADEEHASFNPPVTDTVNVTAG